MNRIVVCEDCGTSFSTEYVDKKFCDVKCRERTMRRRQRDRAKGRVTQSAQRTDVYLEMVNPKLEVLDHTAQLYVKGLTDKPSLFSGLVPEWQPPAGVIWQKQYDGLSWLMSKVVVEPVWDEMMADPVQAGPSPVRRKLTREEQDEMMARGEYPDPDLI